jgi:general secretion pathway protein D
MIYSNEYDYKQVLSVISVNDKIPEQFKLKITVIETNLDESKERGLEISSFVQDKTSDFQYFVNLLTLPTGSTSNLFVGATSAITSSIRFLDSIGVSNIESSPFVTVQSGKDIYFSAVENIPYLNSRSSVEGASSSTVQEITYKDVGLKITLSPIIVNETVFIDLDFIIENITDKTSLTPSTSKRVLKSSFQLIKGQKLLLSGINQKEKSKSTYGIPVFMKLPYLGDLFKFDIDRSINKSLSIMIEIIK